MLILDFVDERELVNKPKRRFLKRIHIEKNSEIKRYSLNVNNKNVIILKITEKGLKEDDVSTLLKIYKGKVLVSGKYMEKEDLKEYLYSPKEYYQRALISSLTNQIKTVNKDWKNVTIKIENFKPTKELYELVRISKNITLITESNFNTEKFLNNCYYEYGAIVSMKNKNTSTQDDVFIDLNKIDNNGKLMINAKGKEFLLYPDARYFEKSSEYQKLAPYNIEYSLICSAFSDK